MTAYTPDAELVALYREHRSTKKVGRIIGRHHTSVWIRLRRLGIEMRWGEAPPPAVHHPWRSGIRYFPKERAS